MSLTVKDLSPDQRVAYDAVVRWARNADSPVLTLAGYAGSGKSTVVSLVAEVLEPPIAFCAYTGKAASVLKRKLIAAGIGTIGVQPRKDGLPSHDERPYCGTIHSLIYRPCDCREPKRVEVKKPCPTKDCVNELSFTSVGVGASNGVAICKADHRHGMTVVQFEAIKPKAFRVSPEKVDGTCKICRGKEWIRRELLDRNYTLIAVDEASMIDDEILRDLKSFGVPIFAIGDHGQLPPVGGVGSLMRNPNLRLEKIHRQAEGNPIIALSKMVREEGRLPDSLPGEAVRFERLRFLERVLEERYGEADAARLLEMGMSVYTNRRRVGVNAMIRRIRGVARSGRELPRAGEHVICLRNMKPSRGSLDEPIYNGMRGVLISDAVSKKNVNAKGVEIGESETQLVGPIEFPDDGIAAREYEMLRQQFGREKTFASSEELAKETGIHSFAMAGALFDYGYAMTVHKQQGSQFDDLVVLVERPGPVSDEDWRRWLYTAITRAASRLMVLR